jgi:Cu/Ag efflux pump CusA
VKDRDLGNVAKDIEARIKEINFDRGYHPELLGEYAAQQSSKNRIFALSLVSFLGIFLILYTDFNSFRLASLAFLGLPFALIGGVLAVLFNGAIISLGSLIGFVTVLGIAARNSIMLFSHYRHLQIEEIMLFGLELIVRGAKERLSPILMTALTTAFALMPIVVSGSQPGQEIEHPMAFVIVGGLMTSALLNLFVMPVLFWKYGEKTHVEQN